MPKQSELIDAVSLSATDEMAVRQGTNSREAPITMIRDWINRNASDGSLAAPSFSFASDPDTGFFRVASNNIGAVVGGSEFFRFSSSGHFNAAGGIFLGGSTATPHCRLETEGANLLALRGQTQTNPQSFAIYNTYTDASNYERLRTYGTAANAFTIASEAAGTGTARGIQFIAGPDGIYHFGNGAVSSNTAFGLSALRSNTTGTNNSAIGVSALRSNTTGNSNSAIGVSALNSNTTGSSNSAIGAFSLNSNTIGGTNSAIGVNALFSNTTGGGNNAIGVNALFSNTTGGNNSAIGVNAGRYVGSGTSTQNTAGSGNVFIGYNVRPAADIQTNQIVIAGYIGSGDGAIGLGSNTTSIGNSSTTISKIYGSPVFTPTASITPENNGDVAVEFTNNTTLTLKAKGSDGTVRSVALTLA